MDTTKITLFCDVVFIAELFDAAISDLRHFQIPNRIPLLLIATFLVMTISVGMGWGELFVHIECGLILFIVGAILFATRVWGGGDAKLLPSVALWVGLVGQPRFLFVMAFVGGLLALLALLLRYVPINGPLVAQRWRENFVASKQVPYGIAIAVAGLDWAMTSIIPQMMRQL